MKPGSLLPDFRPTVVVTNLPVGGDAALGVLEAVRAWSATTPVILLTGAADDGGQNTGFVAVLTEPITVTKLREVVAKFAGETVP